MNNKLKNKIILIMAVITMVCLIAVGLMLSAVIKAKKQAPTATFDSIAISEKIDKISELAVQKIEYRDVVKYSDGNIPFLTKKGYNMVYSGHAKVGIDLKKAEISTNEKEINITLPEAEVLEVNVDENSFEFYDEKHALFNWQDKKDMVEVIKYAKNNIKDKAKKSDSLSSAKEETKKMLASFLEPINDNRDENDKITINIQ